MSPCYSTKLEAEGKVNLFTFQVGDELLKMVLAHVLSNEEATKRKFTFFSEATPIGRL